MIFVNNQIITDYGIVAMDYAPDRLILKKVLQKELKCNKIIYDKEHNVLAVSWIKEKKNG